MSSEDEPGEVNSGADVLAEVKTHEVAAITLDDVDQVPKNSTVQPLLLAPDLLTENGEYACTVCGETYLSLAQLAKHVQFHDRDRPFPCVICGKRFLSRSHHSEHQRVHTGERPFPCNRCERAFTTHHNLKRHQLIHDKEEMYRCNMCGVLFCQEHQLGNISGIIRVLKQHSEDELIDPEMLLNLKPLPVPEPAADTLPKLKLKAIFKEEQKPWKRKKKHKRTHFRSDEDHSPFAEREEKCLQPPFHSGVPQMQEGRKDFNDLVLRTGPKIQKIAYDIEIIL